MKKLLKIAMGVALLGGVLLVAPQSAVAARKYSAWVSINANTASSGNGTNCKSADYYHLQDALDDANDGWVIYLCAGTYRPSDDEDNYFEIYSDVTIVGANKSKTVIDGECTNYGTIQGGDYYDEAYVLTLKNLTMINGCQDYDDYDFQGGGAVAMSNNGDLVCDNVAFTGNWSQTTGGAVWADDVTLNKCTFDANQSAYGGAVTAYGYLVDNASVFSGNKSHVDGGAVALSDGGLFVNSTFTGNMAGHLNPGNGKGGAIYAYQDFGGDLVIRGGKFVGNEAFWGGAIFAYNDDGAAAVRSTKATFTGNAACYGGAIDSDGSMFDLNSAFSRNNVYSNCGVGGAIYVVDYISLSGTKFVGNVAPNDTQAFFIFSCDENDVLLKKVRFDGEQYWNYDC